MSVVGIGLANLQSSLSSPTNPFPITDHTLFVNGRNLGTVESLAGVTGVAGCLLWQSDQRAFLQGAYG